MESVGERIKSLREKAHLSQEELAEQADVSRQSISRWEAGLSSPKYDNLKRLCEVFAVTPDYFMSGESGESCAGSAASDGTELREGGSVAVKKRSFKKPLFIAFAVCLLLTAILCAVSYFVLEPVYVKKVYTFEFGIAEEFLCIAIACFLVLAALVGYIIIKKIKNAKRK